MEIVIKLDSGAIITPNDSLFLVHLELKEKHKKSDKNKVAPSTN